VRHCTTTLRRSYYQQRFRCAFAVFGLCGKPGYCLDWRHSEQGRSNPGGTIYRAYDGVTNQSFPNLSSLLTRFSTQIRSTKVSHSWVQRPQSSSGFSTDCRFPYFLSRSLNASMAKAFRVVSRSTASSRSARQPSVLIRLRTDLNAPASRAVGPVVFGFRPMLPIPSNASAHDRSKSE
jgi:hypothetical protein